MEFKGAVSKSLNDVVTIDLAENERLLIDQTGIVWRFHRNPHPEFELSAKLEETLARADLSTEAKSNIIRGITDSSTLQGIPIRRKDDPRLGFLTRCLHRMIFDFGKPLQLRCSNLQMRFNQVTKKCIGSPWKCSLNI